MCCNSRALIRAIDPPAQGVNIAPNDRRDPLHIRYTARQGVDCPHVEAALRELFQQASQADFALLFSLRHDFPTEWSAFTDGTADFSVTIRQDHFPYFTQGKAITIVGFELYGQDVTKHHAIGDAAMATTAMADHQQFVLSAAPDAPGQPIEYRGFF